MDDPIVEEVRKIRDEHAASFNYDARAIFDDLKRIASESAGPRVSFASQRSPKPGTGPTMEPLLPTR